MAWLGKKRVAFIPVFRPQLDAVPADWEAQILRRIYHDPQPWPTAQPPADPGPVIGRGLVPAALPPAQTPGPDISLRTHIHTTSYGRADIEGIVLPRVQTNLIDVRLETFHDRTHELRGQGFDAAAIVMLGGAGAGTAEAAGFWARFVMVEGVGVWAMELIHVLAGYMDLYANARGPVVDHLGPFDTMAGAGGQHECAFSKVKLGWLDAGAILQHQGRFAAHDLHSVGLVQPAPSFKTTAVKVGGEKNYFVAEARQKVDQFDVNIPNEGVIVYQVEEEDIDPSSARIMPIVHLKTPAALQAGSTYSSDSGVRIDVITGLVGGFSIRVTDGSQPVVMESGQLLFYRDSTRDGTGDVHTPSVIGLGGWQQMRHVFSGDPGVVYAVDQDGRLLFYRDTRRDGTGDVSSPGVIGQGGWQDMLHLTYGGDGIIYAVNGQGQLLFYRDHNRDGTGDVHTPSVIGLGGWQVFRHLFSGGPDGSLYAVVA